MRWLVSLTGEGADLERLVKWQDDENWQILRHEKRGVVLCGPRFEATDSCECVGRIADELILHINRSARYQASDFQGVSRRYIIEQHQNQDHVHAILQTGFDALGVIIETSGDRARKE